METILWNINKRIYPQSGKRRATSRGNETLDVDDHVSHMKKVS